MDWFNGSIPEAITKAKVNNGIFLVFIYDESEPSKVARESLDSQKISSILSSNKFVCIQLKNGSEEAKQFSQIYPLVLMPSIFLIRGQTGVPQEIIGGEMSEESLLKKIEPLINGSEEQPKSSTEENTSNLPSATQQMGATSLPQERKNQSKTPEIAAQEDTAGSALLGDENKSKEITENPESVESNEGQTQEDLTARVERAKLLLEERQREKASEKQEDEKTKELERRRQGQGMALAKQKREDTELKELAMQRRKEKQEDKLHRERVKAQIAADRLERERREALFKNPPSPSPAESQQEQAQAAPSSFSNSANARIKFRFPDSSSVNGTFSSDDTLSTIRNFVRDNASMPLNNFNLISIVHNQPFSEDQINSTLRELGLTPSATINVKPSSTSSIGQIVPSNTNFLNLFWTFVSPIVNLLNYIKGFLGLNSPSNTRNERESSPQDDSTASSSKRMKTEGSYTTRNRTKRGESSQDMTRREGNIYRLNRGTDDDDENNTWNGNSTQQM